MLLDLKSFWLTSAIFSCFYVVQYEFCSHVVLWIGSSLPLLPAHLGGTTPGSSWLTAMFLPHLAPKDTQTEPWQTLSQGHIGGMGIHPACVGHCLGITACCHATNGLVFLDRESLELEVSKCGCIVVYNPQPKLLSFCTPHRLHMGQIPTPFPQGWPLCAILGSHSTALSGVLPVMAVPGQACWGCRRHGTKQRQPECDM